LPTPFNPKLNHIRRRELGMKWNPSTKGKLYRTQTQTNPEGAIVWKEDKYRDLIVAGSNLSPKQDRFYFKSDEQFKRFVDALDKMFAIDPEFLPPLAKFLAKQFGRKTSPAVITGFIASKQKLNNETVTDRKVYQEMVKRIDKSLFRTPKQMAEALYTFQLLTELPIKKVPKSYKKAMKSVLESYDRMTLIKNRLRRREIKLADLIKVLHPKPKNQTIADTYKAIIENRVRLDEQEKQVMATTIMSDSSLTKEEKQKRLEDSIDKMPINMLIRNLAQFSESSLDTKLKIRARLESVLESLKSGDESTFQIFNPFIVMDIIKSDKFQYLGVIKDILDEMLRVYFRHVKEFVGFDKFDDAIVVGDVSGSMESSWFDVVKAIVTTYELAGKVRVELFADDLWSSGSEWEQQTNKLVNDIANDPTMKPLTKAHKLYTELRKRWNWWAGTALVNSVKKLLIKLTNEGKKDVLLFIVSDEVTWAEDKSSFCWRTTDLRGIFDTYKNLNLKGLLYNPVYVSNQGVAIPDSRVLKFGSLNPGVMKLIPLVTNTKEFVRYIKENF